MAQRTNDISVLICAYAEERWNAFVEAIDSLQRQILRPCEIIVVIDHNQSLLKRVREHIPGVTVVENTETRGLSGARNSGVAAARGQIIAFLDDDAVAGPHWLMFLHEGYADPRVLGVGGVVKPLWLDNEPAWLPEEFFWVVGCTYRGLPQVAATIRNPIGANMSFRREVFDTLGGFRSGIGRIGTWPAGCEETELCIRARQHWPQNVFLYLPQADVFHRVPATRTSWRYFCARCYAEGFSKAAVARYRGARDSLASERIYVLQTLPRGVVRGVMEGLVRRDLTGFLRAGVIVVGLAVTTVGYLIGTIAQRLVPCKGTKNHLFLKGRDQRKA
jgi:glycosyltransferase involved in cell wall biosynthesis